MEEMPMGSMVICCYECLLHIKDSTAGVVVKRQTKMDEHQAVEIASWICSLCNATS